MFESIERYKNIIVEKLKPKKIILFGSFARGDFNEGSDIDLIVIGDWNVSFLERIKVLLDFNDQYLPIEPFGYTEEEFRRMVEDENPFILNVLKDGIVLYDACLV
ncbi:MAG: nucleotidyltransferase domain-containing protein [Nitrososphaeria archaeon]